MAEDAPTEGKAAGTRGNTNVEELAASYDVPAIFSNRFYVGLTPSGARVSFAETTPSGKTHFRAAVMLGFEDALLLSKLLNDMISANVVFSENDEQAKNEETVDGN